MPSFGTSLSYPPLVTEAVESMAEAVRVRIARSDPDARSVFEVPREEAFVVLDLVAHAAREDPSLAFRSCSTVDPSSAARRRSPRRAPSILRRSVDSP
jgi:hypothetical protein